MQSLGCPDLLFFASFPIAQQEKDVLAVFAGPDQESS
ncbi:hypothetical protein Poly41_09810 [Novipirellula artificiosorum]|uniref:Uncharacterized protein n=1 Tax=Novipirellula artificiosorum TaxID=2528016 RepID=A0A5C6E1B2_9BACT|nr:hypothetical protein Poly41_09810 [Novipirellula artificiosorum]